MFETAQQLLYCLGALHVPRIRGGLTRHEAVVLASRWTLLVCGVTIALNRCLHVGHGGRDGELERRHFAR